MADIAVVHTLESPSAGTIVFNDGEIGDESSDMYYLTEITGLDGAPIRAPIDNLPQQDSGLAHLFWKGPRHLLIAGLIVVQSTRIGTGIQAIRNDMEDFLRVVLENCLQAEGTWSWSPAGTGVTRSLGVLNEIPLDCQGIVERRFTFGLFAASADWFES